MIALPNHQCQHKVPKEGEAGSTYVPQSPQKWRLTEFPDSESLSTKILGVPVTFTDIKKSIRGSILVRKKYIRDEHLVIVLCCLNILLTSFRCYGHVQREAAFGQFWVLDSLVPHPTYRLPLLARQFRQ